MKHNDGHSAATIRASSDPGSNSTAATGSGGASIPDHVAIIMDGNSRWAKQHGLPRIEGHIQGAKQAQEIIFAAKAQGIKFLTLFAFSKENWRRPIDEVNELMGLFSQYLPDSAEESVFVREQIRLQVIGDINDFPETLRQRLKTTIAHCQSFTGMTVVIGLSYGGRQDIVRATKNLVRQCLEGNHEVEHITEQTLTAALSTHALPPVDFLIRSSGELRVSNFMLWELAYAELYFTTVLWPDFTPWHFHAALESFARRQRRYGGHPTS